jgi:hypothetical protein
MLLVITGVTERDGMFHNTVRLVAVCEIVYSIAYVAFLLCILGWLKHCRLAYTRP